MNDPLPQTSSDINDSNSNANVVPNSMPISVGPEGMSIVHSVETIIPTNVESNKEINEIVPKAESLKPAESAVTQPNNPQSFQSPTNIPIVEKKVEVLDKTTGHEKLHQIEKPLNDLTNKADLEEEDFIKHVEEIHTIQ